jgi:hypothetical protein
MKASALVKKNCGSGVLYLTLVCWAAQHLAGQATSVENAQCVINVAEHGIVPGVDATLPLNRLIESLAGKAGVTLVFPRGQYDFYPENGLEKWRAVANHDNSLKRMAFPLFEFENITVDGGGSTFMFRGRMSPFVLQGVKQATLKNFSIDWNRPFQSELTVVESNDKSFVAEIDPAKYPYSVVNGRLLFDHYDWQDPIGSNIVFDPQTRSPIHNTKQYTLRYSRPIKAKKLDGNLIRIEAFCKTQPPVGSVVVSYGRHPTSRLAPAIHVDRSRDIRIKNVTVHAAGGMGLIVERTENVDLNKMVVTSTDERLVCTRADATHFVGCKGKIELTNCLFEHMLDDGINVHGAYVKIEEYLGDKKFLCEISHFQQWGLVFAEPGDKVALMSRETILPFAETTVKAVKKLNERRFIVTVAEVPESMPNGPLSIENLTWYPDLIMKNNVIRENRARSVLVTTKGKVVIKDNVFSSQMNGILIEGDNNKWYESGAVEDVTIQNNVFENIGFGGGPMYPLLASPLLTKDQRMGGGQYHRNINFIDNTLKSFNGRMVQARSVAGLKVSGNKVEFSKDYSPNDLLPAIDLHYCDSVKIEGNIAEGFDANLKIKQSADSTNVAIGNNAGLESN